MGICPHHCPPEGGSGMAMAAVAVVVGGAVAVRVAGAVVHAVEVVLQVAVIVACSCMAAGAICGLVRVGLWARHRRVARAELVRARGQIEAPRAAIEAPATATVLASHYERQGVR